MVTFIVGNLIATLVLVFAVNVEIDRKHIAYVAEQQKLAQLAAEEREVEADYKAYPELRVKGYTKDQIRIMKIAYNVGSEYGVPETMQGILLQETIAGRFGHKIGGVSEGLAFGKRYYGVTQMKIVAVMDVLKTYPQYVSEYFSNRKLSAVAEEEIIGKLMYNDEFAIRMATLYFKKYQKQAKNMAEAIAMYNQGPAGAKLLADPALFHYVEGVRKHIKYNVRRFNQRYLAHQELIGQDIPQHVASM